MEFWLIRHGESEGNVGRVSSTTSSSDLTILGETQAKTISKSISKPPNIIISSEFLRAKNTAKPAIEKFPKVKVLEWPIHEFIYLPPGFYNNKSLYYRIPKAILYWLRGNADNNYNNSSESFNSLIQRTHDFYSNLIKLNSDFTLVYSHLWFIRSFIWAKFYYMTKNIRISKNPFSRLSILYILIRLTRNIKFISPMRSFTLFSIIFKFPNSAILKIKLNKNNKITIS